MFSHNTTPDIFPRRKLQKAYSSCTDPPAPSTEKAKYCTYFKGELVKGIQHFIEEHVWKTTLGELRGNHLTTETDVI